MQKIPKILAQIFAAKKAKIYAPQIFAPIFAQILAQRTKYRKYWRIYLRRKKRKYTHRKYLRKYLREKKRKIPMAPYSCSGLTSVLSWQILIPRADWCKPWILSTEENICQILVLVWKMVHAFLLANNHRVYNMNNPIRYEPIGHLAAPFTTNAARGNVSKWWPLPLEPHQQRPLYCWKSPRHLQSQLN